MTRNEGRISDAAFVFFACSYRHAALRRFAAA
jgi:NifU-like protein involved in Fe-S cluster formation